MPEYPYFVKAVGIYYPQELSVIKKSADIHQPLFEAITNAWEAILDKFGSEGLDKGIIQIGLYATKALEMGEDSAYGFDRIVIKDNGIGLDAKNYDRLINLRDPSKNRSNKGTGRVQYLHSFGVTRITSVYEGQDGKNERINVTLSKNEHFLGNRSILRVDSKEETLEESTYTETTFLNPIDAKESQYYSTLNAGNLKTFIIRHYLARFCDNRNCLPQISISRYVNEKLDSNYTIESSDVPQPIHEDDFAVKYSKLEDRRVVQLDKEESFKLRSFKESSSELESNALYLVSKGDLGSTLSIDNLTDKEVIDGNRYLFLLSGEYLNLCDSDDRGNISLMTAKDFKKRNQDPSMFPEEVILREDIEQETNSRISTVCQEIAKKEEEKQANIDELQRMFLLDPDTVDSIRKKVKKSSSDAEILNLVYKGEMDKIAEVDAKIKQQVKEIEQLDPVSPDYQTKLQEKVNAFVEILPEQNKTALSKYIARRKLVLELFGKILSKEIVKLKSGGRIDENLLHNLIFQQHTTNPETSDLWLIDDQFLYFKGCSEKQLNKIQINGVKLLKDVLSEEEQQYKNRNGLDIGTRRPDILLYPEEGKCIIIEFKAPDVEVSEHLSQINKYAMTLNNLAAEGFHFHSFYGYLVGENVDYDAVEENDSSFKKACNLGYLFRPNYKVPGRFGHAEGDLYTEIIKYSDLLKRAQLRNRIFIEKLEGSNVAEI